MLDVTKPVQGRGTEYTGLTYVGKLQPYQLVWAYVSGGRWVAIVTDMDGKYGARVDGSYDVINIPSKPITVYANVYGGQNRCYGYMYKSEEEARRYALNGRFMAVALPVTFTPKEC